MSNLLGIHDTDFCACPMCQWGASVSVDNPAPVRQEIDAWDLEREMSNYEQLYGREALMMKFFAYINQC